MGDLSKSILLFVLNWLDAQLTILWVRSNVATEGNGLMARLLEMGNAPFLITKLAIGAFAAYMLYRCSHLKTARYGMSLVLTIYFALMVVHATTGMSALGWHATDAATSYLGALPNLFIAIR
jgi:hypothetical protein